MISKDEVKRIAVLARLELSDEEIKKMAKDLSAILDYFEMLNKIHPVIRQGAPSNDGANFNLRKDEVITQKTGVAEKLIEAAPDKKDGYIKVKAIL